MDYKKKLRLAKEALESGSYDKETIKYIFPELEENWDEEIRKALIKSFEEYLKQGGVAWGKDVKFKYVNVKDAIAWLEKKSEQKPAEWSKEDTEMFGSISSTLSMYMYNTDIPLDIREIHKKEYAWFNKLYNRVFPQPEQEWSEEDKMQLDAAIHLVSSTGHIETANWLKGLKNRVNK